ncbi:MAG TPA: aminoglycoside phosphotransferase family protein [Anaerolineae bacterium]|nr:aminoglycoside phosphotransferase family protein [Anaerolineae bacterium]
MAERFPTELLARLVAAHLAVDPERLLFEPIRTGKHNTSYYVGGTGDDLVLRISPPDDAGFLFYERRMMAQEPQLHTLLRAETEVPVAEILAYDDSRTLVDRDYLLMERLPGQPLTDARLSQQQVAGVLEQVGFYLAQMHTLVADRYGYLGDHHPMQPQSTWVEAFVVMWNMLLDDVVACGGYTPAEADAIRRLLDVYRPHFERPVSASLLHMDVWSQNILVDHAGRVTGLVDLDRALWGDPEIEFAVLDYCGISEPAFWRGYGRQRDTSFSAQIRARFYLLYEVQKYIVIRVWRRNDSAQALQYKRQSFALIEPLLRGLG